MLPVNWSSYKIDTVNSAGLIPHTHTRTSEIIQTFDNEGSILINGHLYKMQKNGLYFIHGLSTHFVSPNDINRYSHSILVLYTTEIERMCENLRFNEVYNSLFLKNGGTVCELTPKAVIETDMLMYDINEIMINQPDSIKYAKLSAKLIDLFETGIRYSVTTKSTTNKFSDILTYISDNSLQKLPIEQICEELHISKYHLCRIFKENMGVTIGSFVRTRRLSVAKQLLVSTNLPVTEISYKCGFTDTSFFTRTFTKEFGISPTKYRLKHKNEI